MTALPRLPSIKQLSPYVTRILGQNPSSFTLQGTNTYLIGHPNQKERLLLDTGSGFNEYGELLRKYLNQNGLTLSYIVISHWHPDHYGGLNQVVTLYPNARLYKYVVTQMGIHTFPNEFHHWADEEVLNVCGVHLKAYYTPGHCDDHISVWIEEEQALFSGDNLLGHGSSVFKDLPDYLASLQRMRDLPNLGRVYPGHGVCLYNGVYSFNQNLEHRQQRKYDVLNVLKQHEPLTEEELVNKLYPKHPDQPRKVQSGAHANTLNYLARLEFDGKVEYDGVKWRSKL